MQHVEIMLPCSLSGVGLVVFLVPGRIEKIAGFCFARGDQYAG